MTHKTLQNIFKRNSIIRKNDFLGKYTLNTSTSNNCRLNTVSIQNATIPYHFKSLSYHHKFENMISEPFLIKKLPFFRVNTSIRENTNHPNTSIHPSLQMNPNNIFSSFNFNYDISFKNSRIQQRFYSIQFINEYKSNNNDSLPNFLLLSESIKSPHFSTMYSDIFHEIVHRTKNVEILQTTMREQLYREEKQYIQEIIDTLDIKEILDFMEEILTNEEKNKETFKFLSAMKSIMDDQLIGMNYQMIFELFTKIMILRAITKKTFLLPKSLPYRIKFDDLSEWKLTDTVAKHIMASEEHSKRFRDIVNHYIVLPTYGIPMLNEFKDNEVVHEVLVAINEVMLFQQQTLNSDTDEDQSQNNFNKSQTQSEEHAPIEKLKRLSHKTDISIEKNYLNRYPLNQEIVSQMNHIRNHVHGENQIVRYCAELYEQIIIYILSQRKASIMMHSIQKQHMDSMEFLPKDFQANMILDEKDIILTPQEYFSFRFDSEVYLQKLKKTNIEEYEKLTRGYESFLAQVSICIKESPETNISTITNGGAIFSGIVIGLLFGIILLLSLPQFLSNHWSK